MSDSILTSTKKLLLVPEDYTVFDLDIMTHINSAFFTLYQLGVGPSTAYQIQDDGDTWAKFFGDNTRFNAVRSYIVLKVRMAFDPPSTSYVIDSFNKQISEFEWRLNVEAEHTNWVDPLPEDDLELVFHGGTP